MSTNNQHNSFLPLLSEQDLSGKWPEQDSTGNRPTTGGSRHHKQQHDGGANNNSQHVQVILCGVRNPTNVGSMMRTCNCFGIGRMRHLHAAVNDETNRKYWNEPHVKRALQSTSVGTHLQFQYEDMPFESMSISQYTNTMLPNTQRTPLVVLEAIAGAVSIYEFSFPEWCQIMVGSENKGVNKEILQQLRQNEDAVVYVPLMGPHKSLNVASALTIALYEYRRQWPGTGVVTLPEEEDDETEE